MRQRGVATRLRSLADEPVAAVAGIRPKVVRELAKLEVESLLDLVSYYPRRYLDRTTESEIGSLGEGDEAVVTARVRRVDVRRRRGGGAFVDVVVEDRSGRLRLVFFNQPWRAKQLAVGREVVVFGRVDRFRGSRQMTNPVVDLSGDQTGRIVPVYPLSARADLSSAQIGDAVARALEAIGEVADPLPERFRRAFGFVDRTTALRAIHAPGSDTDRFAARRRLAFDELWRLQLTLVMRKRARARSSRGISHAVRPVEGRGLVDELLGRLPFSLTGAQQRALAEIARDLAAPEPMHRLLQGDVGAGKTLVALAALLYAVQGGHQGALMVPTEVLAEQHHLAARELLAGLEVPSPRRLGGARPLRVELLTSRTPPAERARLHEALRSGEVDILVGTHALLTDEVVFRSLGVVVVDEQHRFGVEQRARLRDKGSGSLAGGTFGREPDVLVMTATPIPRTAAMTVYGDLDLTVLDELPLGRQPVRTRWVADPELEVRVWERVRSEVRAGHQAYVICPLVMAGEPEEDGPEEDGPEEDGPEENGPEQDRSGQDEPDEEEPDRVEGESPGPTAGTTASSVTQLSLPFVALAAGRRSASASAPSAGRGRDGADGRSRGAAATGAGGGATVRRGVRSAVEERERLARGELAGLRVGLLHGQLPSREKEEVMAAFRRGDLDVLVATTVVEVGVDVANATVMVVEDADRFGIAQLHQLRGRVGRGGLPSWCYLLAPEASEDGARRLRALEQSTDGFELAEVDLELRGEGTVLGTRQKGRNDLRLASLRRDRDLVGLARRIAEEILEGDPALARHELLADELRLFVSEEEAEFLFKS